MNALTEYRRKLLERWTVITAEFCSACEAQPATRVAEGGWTVHQVASHVRDMHRAVYAARVRRTLAEENPLFESIDPDDWMAAHYGKDEPVQKILKEFKVDVDNLCEALQDLPGEAWSRVSQHETMGEGLTAQLWAEHGLAHIEAHLDAVQKLT